MILNNIKQKIRYKLYQHIASMISYGQQVDKYNNFCKNATIHPSAKIDSRAGVGNFSGKPELIQIGENSVIRGELIVFADAGKIEIGKDCYFGEGARLWSADSIKIGDRVFISHNVNIHDTDSHSIDPNIRYEHFVDIMTTEKTKKNNFDVKAKSIVIENDVWIGFNSTILKGVKIGKGAIIGTGSLVTKDVPEFVIMAGNPARVIKKIDF